MRLISSRDYEARKEWGVNRFYKPVFLHEGSTLSADSSDYNPAERFFDAFGNVVITQPNGTVVYADKLHYIKDTRIAILTNNVRMVDPKGAVLTTNHLIYNLNTKIGNYTGGGRIVNETDTLTSKNGHYFENTSDAFFRYDVVVRTPETNIFTDTLKYNSLSKMAYFYGPTNIKGKGGGNLYTENGDYHTETDRARFGKNNLYTEESRFLRGDSLYYDGKAGYGRAIKNVVFIDTVQQGILYGQRGVYLKKDESITMTEDAYMVMVTKNDSTDRQEVTPDSLLADSIMADTYDSDSLYRRDSEPPAADSVYMSADTLYSRVILLKDYEPIVLNLQRDGGDLDEDEDYDDDYDEGILEDEEDEEAILPAGPIDSLASDSTQIPVDSLDQKPPQDMLPDSLAIADADSILHKKTEDLPADSLMKIALADSLLQKELTETITEEEISKALIKTTQLQNDTLLNSERQRIGLELAADSLLIDSASIPVIGQADSSLVLAKIAVSNAPLVDSTTLDTAKTRIVKAYHNMRIFKSDLQARADSAYYGYADSIIRCYGDPMIWAQGSQLSGDTIYMQLKNQRLDNMLLKTNAFIVSTQLDSVKFNQVKGRKITGFFTDNKLDRMFVDGNAESIYYTMEAEKISGMTKSIGSRIKILFNNNEVSSIVNIRKTETSYTPLLAIDADKEILPGFIWKPKDRPKSKEEVINPRLAIASATRDSAAMDSNMMDSITAHAPEEDEMAIEEAAEPSSQEELPEIVPKKTEEALPAKPEEQDTPTEKRESQPSL